MNPRRFTEGFGSGVSLSFLVDDQRGGSTLIPNQWYAILESSEIRPGKAVGITRMGERLVLWRDTRGQVACLGDMCVHRGAALSHGELCGDHLACPFHGLQYHATGRVRVIPANGKETPVPKGFATQAYAVREAHGFVWLWWGEAHQELPSPPWFTDMDDDALTYAPFRQRWPVHYSRVIENQLDVTAPALRAPAHHRPRQPHPGQRPAGRANRTAA